VIFLSLLSSSPPEEDEDKESSRVYVLDMSVAVVVVGVLNSDI
jgi:hypothetical protein